MDICQVTILQKDYNFNHQKAVNSLLL